MKVIITEGGLYQRLRRRLKAEGRSLRITRAAQQSQLGRYFVASGNRIVEHHIDLEELAQRLKAIEPWETLK
jgi:hypothetical protein